MVTQGAQKRGENWKLKSTQGTENEDKKNLILFSKVFHLSRKREMKKKDKKKGITKERKRRNKRERKRKERERS